MSSLQNESNAIFDLSQNPTVYMQNLIQILGIWILQISFGVQFCNKFNDKNGMAFWYLIQVENSLMIQKKNDAIVKFVLIFIKELPQSNM